MSSLAMAKHSKTLSCSSNRENANGCIRMRINMNYEMIGLVVPHDVVLETWIKNKISFLGEHFELWK
jgi:hypothetical protein